LRELEEREPEERLATVPDFFVEEVRLEAAAARLGDDLDALRDLDAELREDDFTAPRLELRDAVFLAEERDAPERADDERDEDFRAAEPVDFAEVFFAVDFLAADFLAVVFFAAVFLAVVFLAPDFADDLAEVFLAVVFLAVVLLAVFLAGAVPVPERAAEAAAFGSFLAPLTTSLKLWPGLNFGTDVFLIFTVSPVRGLRPVRAGRATFSKTPKPVMATRSPAATERVMVSTTASTASVAAFLLPSCADSLSIS
jgi:hypothetical protein